MKVVGRVFSIIGGVFAILFGIGLVLGSVLILLLNVPEIKDYFMEAMQYLTDQTSLPFTHYADLIIEGSTFAAIINLIAAALSFIAAGFSLSCHKKKTYIASIVFGALAYFQFFVVLGAIFGVIFDKKTE